jgi:hypothetical protein
MRFLNLFFRHFYSAEVTTSESQLRKDFGEFPPKPLSGKGLTGEFTTIRVHGIGEHIHNVVMTKRIAEGAEDEDSLSSTIKNLMPDDIANLKRYVGSEGIGSKALMWFALGTIFLASTLKLIRMGPQAATSLGFFAPLRKDEYEIVIKTERVAKKQLDAASMISHEHIHLLQHKEEHITTYSRFVTWSDDQLFTESARSNAMLPHLKYILERHEVEARLHELVVSFYRTHKNLPLSVPSFLALLAASKQLGWLVTGLLKLANIEIDPPFIEFDERDMMQARDLEMVMLSMPDDLVVRFINEVLPVMYGNLLKYYGDDAVSQNFQSKISRPNFYDQLYSLPPSFSFETGSV